MADFNAVNRGVYIADNLNFLRSLNSECIDLVCIDPPFAKNETFTADRLRPPFDQQEQENETRLLRDWGIADAAAAAEAGLAWPENGETRGGYFDIWSWETDIHEDWMLELEARHTGLYKLIDAALYVSGRSMGAYLCYMAIRLLEIWRVLKPTGTIFLFCDNTANGYLRQMLDGIFGGDNFRNGIVWRRTAARKGNLRRALSHDFNTLFRYSKSDAFTWNRSAVMQPYDPENLDPRTAAKYSQRTPEGRLYQLVSIDAPEQNPAARNHYELMGHTRTWRWNRDRMAQAVANGRVIQPSPEAVPRQILYLDEQEGLPLGDLWIDINGLNSQSRERTGYPTQKPVALAERIIAASTNPEDIVLDCFAGCAFTAMAAERLGRQWVACDFNPRAWTVFKRQFNKPFLALLTCNDETTGQQVMNHEPQVTVHGPEQLPRRTSPLTDDWPGASMLGRVPPPPLRYKRETSLLSREEMMTALLTLSNGRAWCCGFISEDPDGSWALGNYDLDHIVARSQGGSDDITNRMPLCRTHNRLKNDLDLTLDELRTEVATRKEMKVSPRTLPRLDTAINYAVRIRQEAYARRYGPPAGG